VRTGTPAHHVCSTCWPKMSEAVITKNDSYTLRKLCYNEDMEKEREKAQETHGVKVVKNAMILSATLFTAQQNVLRHIPRSSLIHG
jgi:hypothetical protein